MREEMRATGLLYAIMRRRELCGMSDQTFTGACCRLTVFPLNVSKCHGTSCKCTTTIRDLTQWIQKHWDE